MPPSFSITTSTELVTLRQRQAEAVFNVTNISGRTITGRARLVPWTPDAAEWLSLVGPTERRFVAGESRRYTVQVAVPDDAPRGRQFFRLDMVGGENADEDYTEGPTVKVRTAGESIFPWWAVGAAALLLIAAVVAFWWANRGPEMVAVPDVASLLEADARATLEAVGFDVGAVTQQADQNVDAGRVVRTRPEAGEPVAVGEVVGLVLSTGPPQTTVPVIEAGASVEEVTEQLENADLLVADEVLREEDPSVAAGRVIRTEPAAGVEVAPGTPVQLVVAAAPAAFDLVLLDAGENPRQVIEALQQQLARAAGTATALVDGAPSLLVVGVDEAEALALVDLFADLGAEVEMRPSAGADGGAVPLVVGIPQDEALAALRAACEPSPCLNAAVQVRESSEAPAGVVIESQPVAGADLARGEMVLLVVSGGPGEPASEGDAVLGRMIVSDIFVIAGQGTVLTGQVEQGEFRQGASVLIRTPEGEEVERVSIALITVGKESHPVAETGDEVGLLMPQGTVAEVEPGFVVEALE